MRVFRTLPPLPTALLLLTGVGIALNFTWLESKETWLQILVGVMAMGASFVAGLLSPRLVNLFVVWIIVLGSIAVAFAVFGASSADVPPILFAIMLSLIYGIAAYLVFGVGWAVRVCLVGPQTSKDGDL